MARNTGKYDSFNGMCEKCGSKSVWRDVTNDQIICEDCDYSVPLGRYGEEKDSNEEAEETGFDISELKD